MAIYRIAYKVNENGAVIRTAGLHTLADAQQLTEQLNTRHREEVEYFVEAVNLNSLSRQELFKLVEAGQLTMDEVLSCCSLYASPVVLSP